MNPHYYASHTDFAQIKNKTTTLVVFNGGNQKTTVLNAIFALRQCEQSKNKRAFVDNSTTPVHNMFHIMTVDAINIVY